MPPTKEKGPIDIFHLYLDSYAKRDKEGLFSLFDANFSGFGTGEDEYDFSGNKFMVLISTIKVAMRKIV
jgi:hypothetical protein